MEVHLTIDFYDDLIQAHGKWNEDRLRETVRELKKRNVTTIHWIDHGRLNTGLWDDGSYLDGGGRSQELAKTVPDPLAVVCDEAHKIGLKVIAVIKPWDMGFGSPYDSAPFSHPSARVRLPHVGGMNSATRFIRENPHMRLRLHPSLLPTEEEMKLPITTMRLWHESAELPKVGKVSLWVSPDNENYELYQGPMKVEQVTLRRKPPVFAPAPQKDFGPEGEFACIQITGLNIKEHYVRVGFEGKTGMANTLEALTELRGPGDELLKFTYGLVPKQGGNHGGGKPYSGVAFDATRGGAPVTRTHAGAAKSGGRFRAEVDELPLLAMGRGRNEYMFGPIEFAYPQVQEFLLNLIAQSLDSGADGVDIRQSTHTESLDWENYGFNEPVVEAFRQRYGVDPLTQPFGTGAMRDLRAEFYDQFLEQASQLVRSRGAKILTHLDQQMRYPASQLCWQGIAWHWEKWLSSGMLDGVTFKSGVREDDMYPRAMALCKEHGLFTIFTRKPSGKTVAEDFERYFPQARSANFDAINLYELAVFATLAEDGQLSFKYDQLWRLAAAESATGTAKV